MRAIAVEYGKFIAADIIGSVLRFPLWWYSEGVSQLATLISQRLQYRWKSYSFVIWMQNMFVPMFGQYDWSGRLVSFVMRLVVFIGRAIAFVAEAMLYLIVMCLYLIAPPVSLLLFVFNILS